MLLDLNSTWPDWTGLDPTPIDWTRLDSNRLDSDRLDSTHSLVWCLALLRCADDVADRIMRSSRGWLLLEVNDIPASPATPSPNTPFRLVLVLLSPLDAWGWMVG